MTSLEGNERREFAECQQFFRQLSETYAVLSVKLYRLRLDLPPGVPVLPCLDHEAMLHEGIARHAAAYIQDRTSSDLHEVVFVPAHRYIGIDSVSTIGECSKASEDRLVAALQRDFPACSIRVKGPSWVRGERRVAKACRAQVALRDVLLGDDLEKTKVAIERLQTIGALMEKESRVASWSVRTVTGPLLALAGFLSYQILGSLGRGFNPVWVAGLQYTVVGLLGAFFLYYGLKAVQLTEMANRVWKRSAEYGLILSERCRAAAARADLAQQSRER